MLRGRRPWLLVAAVMAVVCLTIAVGPWVQRVRAWYVLAWAGLAGAAVFAAGLVVPAAISRRDRRVAELAAEQARVAQVEADLRAVMRPLPVPTWPGRGPGRLEGSPAALLRAERQVVGFTGRRAELRALGSWARGSTWGVVRLITGPGGAGKTRLAVELATSLETAGWWQCGFLQVGRGGEAIAAIAAAGQPTLLVVDYAEARTDLEALLEALAAHDGDPVIRVLLLARTPGEWCQPDGPLRRNAAIQDVLAGAQAVKLGPLTGIALRHQETFDAALKAFADHYGIPVPATTLRPVAKDTPVLLLHTAALTAVLCAREGRGTPASVDASEDIVDELLGHEDNYWSHTLAARGLDQLGVGSGAGRQVVAIAGLLGADDEQEARQVLRRLPVLADASELTVEQVLGWLRELYPATSSCWLGSIQPDLLLEYLVTSVFSASIELADAALTGLSERRATQALAVLARSLDHYPASADPLLRRLLMGHADVLVAAAVRLARNLDNAAFGQLLADILTDAQVTDEVLTALAADLRQVPVSLAVVTIAVNLRIGVGELAAGQLSDAIEVAASLTSAADQLEQSRFQGAAVGAHRAAVTLYRAAEEAAPGRYRADLARALTSLGATLSRLGQERDARPVEAEAVELYRAAQEAAPGRYRADLARALTSLGVTLGNLGAHRDARPVEAEAVELYRAAEEAAPGRYRADLARALTSLGVALGNLGAHRDARPVVAEAVELYRAAEEAAPGRYRADLARALTSLGAALSRLGQERDARPVEAEAVELYRAAEEAAPGRYRADLARALTSLGAALGNLGAHRDARPVKAEAVELYRAAEEAAPGRYRADLARALTSLGAALGNLGAHRDARPVVAEAVELYRAAEEAAPGRYRADLARALTSLGAALGNLGAHRDARPVKAEAVELYRAAEEAAPGRYRADLARALTSLGATLSRLGQERDARPVEAEAVELYRAAQEAAPGRYRADLARALTSLGVTLGNLGAHRDARPVEAEAVELYRAAQEAAPGRYRADLARALTSLGVALGNLGAHRDARPVEAEAVELYRAAEEAAPGRYRADLARALTSLGAALSRLGQERDARPVKAEAVELYRAAEEAAPGRYRADLARALTSLGVTLGNLGRPERALTVTTEAVSLYRVLTDADPAAYQGRLADTLIVWSGILLDLGRLEEAEDARREADLYGHTS